MEIFLAIDYGTQRVGLARSYGTLAEPLTIVQNTPELFDELKKVLSSEAITQIVVGMSENTMAEKTTAFVAELKKHTDLPIHIADETMSSATVHQKLHERNRGKAQYMGDIDHFAAAEFLQEFLDLNA